MVTLDGGASLMASLLPINLRLLARGLAAGAFCWDEQGELRPDYEFAPVTAIKADLGFVAIVEAEVREDAWLGAMSVMGNSIECPWGRTLVECVDAHRVALETIRRRFSQLPSVGALSRDNDAVLDDIRGVLSIWNTSSTSPTRVKSHYRQVLNESVHTTYPSWLLSAAGVPNVVGARAFVSTYPAADDAPLRFACWLHAMANAARIVRRLG